MYFAGCLDVAKKQSLVENRDYMRGDGRRKRSGRLKMCHPELASDGGAVIRRAGKRSLDWLARIFHEPLEFSDFELGDERE